MATKPTSPARQHRTYYRLQVTAHELKKTADRVLERTGLTTSQTAVMAIVQEFGPLTQRSVAQHLGLNESAVTAMVRRLVSGDYLERSQDIVDARVRVLHLTERGTTMLEEANVAFAAINSALESALNAKQLAALDEMLTAISDQLNTDF